MAQTGEDFEQVGEAVGTRTFEPGGQDRGVGGGAIADHVDSGI